MLCGPRVRHYRGTWLDHTLLSPSGRCSKRARAAADRRMGEALQRHADRYDLEHASELEDSRVAEEAEARAAYLRALRGSAMELRTLADRGMRPRYHRKHAAKLEAEASALESANATHPPAPGCPAPGDATRAAEGSSMTRTRFGFLLVLALLLLPAIAHAQVPASVSQQVEQYTLTTPYGEATLIVHQSGLATLLVARIGIAITTSIERMPLLPGMEQATVDGHLCVTKKFGGMSPHGSGLVVLTTPIPAGTGGSVTQALAAWKKNVKEAGGIVEPCKPGQG